MRLETEAVMATLTVPRIVAALRKVPAKAFRITELAPHLIDAKGKADIAKCIDQQGELNLAITEVEVYVRDTKTAARALRYIGGRTSDEDDD